MKLGNIDIIGGFIGTKEILKIFQGDNLIFEKDPSGMKSQVVSDALFAMDDGITGFEGYSIFTEHLVYNAASSFQLTYHNAVNDPLFYPKKDTGGYGTFDIKVSIEYSGTKYPVYFNGNRTITLNEHDKIKSDVVSGLTVTDDSTIRIITYVSNLSVDKLPNNYTNFEETTGSALGDFTDSGTPTLDGRDNLFGPNLIHAIPLSIQTPTVMWWGDSITRGPADIAYPDMLCKKLRIPYMNVASGQEYARWLVTPTYMDERIKYLIDKNFTHIFVGDGLNDCDDYEAVDIISDLTTIGNLFRTYVDDVYYNVLTTETTSTDNWATATNQTPYEPHNTRRTAVNDWIRSQTIYKGIMNVGGKIEVDENNILTVNGSRMITNGTANYYTDDGIHPNDTLNQYIADQIENEFKEIIGLGPVNGNYLTGFNSFIINSTSSYPADVQYTNDNGIWQDTNSSVEEKFALTTAKAAVGSEIAFKVLYNSNCMLFITENNSGNTYAGGYGVAIDESATYYVNDSDFNNTGQRLTDNTFVVLVRDTLSTAKIYSDDGFGNRTLLYSFTTGFTQSDVYITSLTWYQGVLGYPQGKNLI